MTASMPARPFVAPASVAALVRQGVMDPELAALLSLTVEGGIPAAVAGGAEASRAALREALVAFVPPGIPIVRLAVGEDFAWMPQAGELGWRSTRSAASVPGLAGAVMIADLVPRGTWGETAHLAIRALTAGYTLLATAGGSSLDEVLGQLAAPPVAAMDDELTRMGVVLVLDGDGRVEIAHYLRPVARDPGGHVQRMPPAALAARSGATGSYDHFAWGVVAELAGRTGRRPIPWEREQARRMATISAAATGT